VERVTVGGDELEHELLGDVPDQVWLHRRVCNLEPLSVPEGITPLVNATPQEVAESMTDCVLRRAGSSP
jgi:hypothetical protein